jgi:hypothetical protein
VAGLAAGAICCGLALAARRHLSFEAHRLDLLEHG